MLVLIENISFSEMINSNYRWKDAEKRMAHFSDIFGEALRLGPLEIVGDGNDVAFAL